MSPQTTRPADAEDARGTETRTLRLRRLLSPLVALSGVLLLVGAARSATDDRRRAGVLALAGGGLLVAWVRRQGPPTANDPEAPDVPRREGDAAVSAEATAHREQSTVLDQPETNPRGVSGEPDVEAETGPDEGDVRFTAEQDAGSEPKPDLDGEADPRIPDDGDPTIEGDHVEVDLSEAAMADEASEATGPDSEQAYPAREGTDPEPTAENAPERGGAGAATNPGPTSGGDGADGETGTGDDADEESAPEDESADDEERS